ncbi:hypothetical protein [Agromyces aureus]|uniref:DUF998 domain-containing protein n=1 Tax=Agromyces aureus TaxID=453304 RepID=A0A191WB56_9MICO|nr:hypothetical protein [Agromyces aureus]ANJ25433.1 hypothetical protein ATC03_00245 [Agromyces aureus]
MIGTTRVLETEDLVPTALKTDRYLRLSLVFLIVALFVGVLIQTVVVSWDPIRFGWQVLPSISHSFYTPARFVFVSVLVAASLAMLAISGRRRPTIFLDLAALFAPLIAIVPTALDSPADSGEAAGLTCIGSDCLPAGLLAEIRASVATYIVMVVVIVVAMYGVRKLKDIATTPAHVIVSVVALVIAAGLAALAFAPGLSDGFPFNLWPLREVHFAAVLLFFGAFAALPILYGWRPAETDETAPTPRQARIYRAVAWLMGADLVFLVLVFFDETYGWGLFGDVPVVLLGESIALALFAWFWWVQTLQRWDDLFHPFRAAALASPTG